MWTITYYETANGKSQVAEYLDGLDGDEASAVTFDIDLLAEFGIDLGMPYVSHIDGELWELRSRRQQVHRILYFAASRQRMVLLHAFTKKTPRTPDTDKKIAKRRLKDFKKRDKE